MIGFNTAFKLPPPLDEALGSAAINLIELVRRSSFGSLAHYRWHRNAGTIDIQCAFYKGDPAQGSLTPYSPRNLSTKFTTPLGDAAVAALAAGYSNGNIVAGRDFGLWHIPADWIEGDAPPIKVVRLERMYGPALLEPVEPHEAKSSSTEALRTAGRLLRPGEIVAVWGRRTTEATAHEAIHRDHLLTEAASNYKIAVDDPKEALYPMIKRGGCDHYLWRTPEDEPQAVVLIATDRSWSIEGPVAVRKPRPVAIAPL